MADHCKHDECNRRIQTWRTGSDWCHIHRPCAVCGGTPAKSRSRDDRWPGHWCDFCLQRFIRQGDPTKARPYGQADSLQRRFDYYTPDEVDENGCLIWQGPHSSGHMGYGTIRNEHGKMEQAHRAAWRLRHGPIPDGKLVLHHCDVPPCVNDEHLHLGTHADNMKECLERGRKQIALTEDEVREVRARHELGVSLARLGKDFGVAHTTIRKCVRREGAYSLIE